MSNSLETYDEKRDFTKTSEPKGVEEKTSGERRFVIQRHEATNLHYDFRLEWDGILLSWAVPKGPSYSTKDKRLAVKVEDHPLAYRDFEGNIPKGEYGGGTVLLFDEGTWEPQQDPSPDSIKMILHGKRLQGKWALVKMKGKSDQDNLWLLLKEKDQYAKEKDDLGEIRTSIRSGRTMDEISMEGNIPVEDKKSTKRGSNETSIVENKTKKNKTPDSIGELPFDETQVQLAKLTDKVPLGESWVYELKYDGYRILTYKTGNSLRFITRNGLDYTDRFKAMIPVIKDQIDGENFVLDGEMVIFNDEGITEIKALQSYLKNPNGKTLSYMVFDLLALNGEDLRQKDLLTRKQRLKELMKDNTPPLYYSDHTKGHGQELFDQACARNMEGIIAKKGDASYDDGRRGGWLKIKCQHRQEFVIGGFTLSEVQSQGFSSLMLGVYDGENLIDVGRVGTGFSHSLKMSLLSKMNPLKRKTSPFKEEPDERPGETITWLTPKLVAEVSFATWTKNGLLRQASFKGLREDKVAKDVVNEEKELQEDTETVATTTNPVAKDEKNEVKLTSSPKKSSVPLKVSGIIITHPDKNLFEDAQITKRQVAEYYEEVGPRIMPYIKQRILSFLRCPHGIEDPCFFQKHLDALGEGMKKIAITEKDGQMDDYVYLTSVKGLVYAAQIGIVELHMWGSQIKTLEKPDFLVFDLDPDEDLGLDEVRHGVKDLKDVLDELSLTSFIKTSGGKGYHMVVPLKPNASWEEAKDFSRLVAQVLEKKWPKKYTSNRSKAKRKGKIYIDYQRNGRGATSVAPYSLRARKGAPVSMPISWDQVDAIAPNEITLKKALELIKEDDPWKGIFDVNQSLKGKEKEVK